MFYRLRKHGPRHVVSILALADIAGGFTVCAAVTVSSFLFTKVLGKGQFYVLAEPIFWLCLLVLAATAVIQVSRALLSSSPILFWSLFFFWRRL